MEAAPDKTASVQPLTSHLTKHPSKTRQGILGAASGVRTSLLMTFSHRRASFGCPVRTYIPQIGVDTGYCLEDLPKGRIVCVCVCERERERERERESGNSVPCVRLDDDDDDDDDDDICSSTRKSLAVDNLGNLIYL